MKINIRELAAKLFCKMEIALDLDTGELYIVQFHKDKVGRLKNFRILPNYSSAAMHQEYILMIRKQFGSDPWEGCDQYPQFSIVENRDETEEMKEYIHNSHAFCENSIYARTSPVGVTADGEKNFSYPNFFGFENKYKLNFAKEWCKKEGYAWYESSARI